MKNLKFGLLIIALGALMSFGCTPKEEKIESKGDISTATYNDLVNRYNKLIENSDTSDLNLIQSDGLLKNLDDRAIAVRRQATKIRLQLPNYSRDALRLDMATLDILVQDALTIIGQLEDQASNKNMTQVRANAEITIKESARAARKERAAKAGQAVAALAGLRDLFLAQYNDLVDLVNATASQLPHEVRPPDINPSRQGNLIPDDQSPIVTSLDQGGRTSGVARDSLTGQPIANASVGFKKRPESRTYFFETQSDPQGHYESPYLMPGGYYVDIRRPGYVDVQSQPVTISRGQQSQTNISMTQPLAAGVFRITLSWTGPKEGAVRDVDSYLAIPGISAPLGFQLVGRSYGGAHLDRDDTNWNGPETVTIHELHNGTYAYYVNNYNRRTDRQALGLSEIKILVYKGDRLVNNFSVPPGTGLTYEVFRIVDGEVVPVEKYNDQLSVY